jgi:hypothetical protein
MSESRQALIFKRRQTQQRPSAELGAQGSEQTLHLAGGFAVSAAAAFLAFSKICFATTGISAGGTGLRLIQ